MNIKSINIFIDNGDEMPPPYCYTTSLEISPQRNQLHLSLKLDYHSREDMSLEEVEAEGFSDNDDFEWVGNLGKNWFEAFQHIWSKTKVIQSHSPNFVIQVNGGEKQSVSQDSKKQFEFFVQELIQAVYEIEGLQEILVLDFLDNRSAMHDKIKVSFQDRQFDLIQNGKIFIKIFLLNTH